MITGKVNANNEAIVPVVVYDVSGRLTQISATIDTGFSGFLTLPEATIELLQLSFERTETYTLGDNNDVEFDIFRATISWDEKDRNILVVSTESNPLIGMSMLHGFGLYVDVVDGGVVSITIHT